jgi:hypothetical protein
MKKLLRRTTSLLSLNKPKPDLKHRRSISDISLRMPGAKKDAFKDRHLAELVRLCGSSNFDLPPKYAHGTLSLPTCFRATAQYLVQRGMLLYCFVAVLCCCVALCCFALVMHGTVC